MFYKNHTASQRINVYCISFFFLHSSHLFCNGIQDIVIWRVNVCKGYL
jgi:hypothetical protein